MHALYRSHMGSDLEVVNDARVSFGKASTPKGYQPVMIPHRENEDTPEPHFVPKLSQDDRGLIGFLARGCMSGEWKEALDSIVLNDLDHDEAHELLMWAKNMPTHWTPFGHQVVKLVMKAPVPIRTQCFKSKIGFVENEESRRYIDSTPELYVPEFRKRPEGSIKQGSGGLHPDNGHWKIQYEIQCGSGISLYERMINDGISPEQARFVLPQGCYVNWVWTGSLYAYAELYNKRSDRQHAQQEVADLMEPIDEIMQALFPVSWPALTRR